MQHDEKQLFQLANEHPYYTFTMEEIAVLCNVSRDFVTRVRSMPDSPFCSNKCRPEWFARWMKLHPEFQLTKTAPITEEFPAKPAFTNPRRKRSKRVALK